MTAGAEEGRRLPSAAGDRAALLGVAEAAAYLGVHEAFIRRLVLQRRIRFYRVGRYIRFRITDLKAFVDAGRQDPIEVDLHSLAARRSRAKRAT